MTWAEWGSLVRRNGVRRTDREADLAEVRWHGNVGDGRVRLIFKQYLPGVSVDGSEPVMIDYEGPHDGWDSDEYGCETAFSIAGTTIQLYRHRSQLCVFFRMTEPDGTVWDGQAGYLPGDWFELDRDQGAEPQDAEPWPQTDETAPSWVSS